MNAVVILGGGFGEVEGLPQWTVARLEAALKYREADYFITLSGGSVHKPSPVSSTGMTCFESVLAAQYLARRDVGVKKLRYETSSYDTVGNAYFARMTHIQPLKLTHIHIITSAFHMPRAQAIFELMFDPRWTDWPIKLTFESVANLGLSHEAVTARAEKEQAGLALIREKARHIESFDDIYQWMFEDHQAYCINGDIAPLNAAQLKSY